jgi:histone demethylase JARID1
LQELTQSRPFNQNKEGLTFK